MPISTPPFNPNAYNYWGGGGVGDSGWGSHDSYQHFYIGIAFFSVSFNVTSQVAVSGTPDVTRMDMDVVEAGASILIPGYDLLHCNMEGDCEWSDWVLGVGYGARVAAKAGIKGGAKAATRIADESETVQRWMSRAELEATRETGLLRGGREGTHFVTDAANRSAQKSAATLGVGQHSRGAGYHGSAIKHVDTANESATVQRPARRWDGTNGYRA